jgi:hypothetical protein
LPIPDTIAALAFFRERTAMQSPSSAEPYDSNPRLLAKCHIGVAVTFIVLSVSGFILFPEASVKSKAILAGLFALGLIHAALAPTCDRRNELARRISELLFSALILAFPVGTLLSIYLFLPATQWQRPAPEGGAESKL